MVATFGERLPVAIAPKCGTAAQANIKNPREIGDKINKTVSDAVDKIKGLFKKNK